MSTVVIFDIKRFAVHDGPGIRTTVFLKGCPLRCGWCHNPESQSPDPFTVQVGRKLNGKTMVADKTYGERIGVESLMEILLRDRHFYEESGGGITFSGGEPMWQLDSLVALLGACRQHGLHTALDTSGFAEQDHFRRVMELTDLFLFDLKFMDGTLHRKYTGVENGMILSNADFLLDNGARLIIRIPVVPGVNTSEKETGRFIRYLGERSRQLEEVHLLPYHRIAGNKYSRLRMKQLLPDLEEAAREFMDRLKRRFEETGLVVSIGG